MSHDAHANEVSIAVRSPDDLSRTRQAVVRAASESGIVESRAAKLALAVSEVATNALIHGDGDARLTIATDNRALTVRVSNRGSGIWLRVPTQRPAPAQDSGRGLRLAERLCDRMDYTAHSDGVVVTLVMLR